MSIGIDTGDIEYAVYSGKGGQTRIHQLFADDLGDILLEPNQAVIP